MATKAQRRKGAKILQLFVDFGYEPLYDLSVLIKGLWPGFVRIYCLRVPLTGVEALADASAII